ncbi:hypothetical protein F5144DRAFT_492561 [Chaetomium tenue]|uniref:Uncharacterized protein n=1 Tax=Chaetomium tenue TaxID=1854479 RepID=A0ACB7P4S9_9PEZI|nr:hypothetical protein F5144DRAFT_492561 [Chaetomium globosum]
MDSLNVADIVSMDGYTFDQIVAYIVDARRRGTESVISLPYPADPAWDLGERLDEKLVDLDELKIRRFEYDYQSGIAYIDIRPETSLHSEFLYRAQQYFLSSLARYTVTIQDAALRQRIIKHIRNLGTSRIAVEGTILKQADFAFGFAMNPLPCLGESQHHVERKLVQYVELTGGKIEAAVALNGQYPSGRSAQVALRVVDGATTGTWVQYFDTVYDEDCATQPDGQLGLYISDFLGPAGLPVNFCRPSTAERASGVSRDPQVTLTYKRLRSIFLKARSIHQGTYPGDGYDDVENDFTIFEEAESERQRADDMELAQREEEATQRADELAQRLNEAMQEIATLKEQLRLASIEYRT